MTSTPRMIQAPSIISRIRFQNFQDMLIQSIQNKPHITIKHPHGRRIKYCTPVCSDQPSVSLDLSSNLVTDSIGKQGGRISVSAASNSWVAVVVRARVRLDSLSKRSEMALMALVRR